MELYKILNKDGRSYHGGNVQWSLPTRNPDGTYTPGEWMPAIERDLIPCKNGYHLVRRENVVLWLGDCIFTVEHRGEMLNSDDKVVVRECRLLAPIEAWTERTARLFACDCVEHKLPIFEREHPNDDCLCQNIKQTIKTARRFANGQATRAELDAARDATRDAIWDIVGDAAWYATRDAAWDAAWYAARDAAWYAAGDAAGDAAKNAAWNDAWNTAEREWQTERLFEYLEGRAG